MNTDLIASDRAVQRIAIILAKGNTSTSTEEESTQRWSRHLSRYFWSPSESPTPFAATLAEIDLSQPLLDSSDYVSRESYGLQASYIYPTITMTTGSDYWNIIEPTPRQPGGIEAATYRFAKRIASIPEVLAVTYSKDADVHLVWTFIQQRNKAIRRRVYREELQLMGEHPRLTFDFNIVALDDVQGHTFSPGDLQGRIVFYRDFRSHVEVI